jgi:hypothetical protein
MRWRWMEAKPYHHAFFWEIWGGLRTFNVAANPKKTKLGLSEGLYVGHVVSSSEGTSFTDEKRLKVLDFPLPDTHRGLLMFIGLANYFRDHVPNITEMLKSLRDMISVAKGANLSTKLIWTEERIVAFKECQIAVSNCQQLYFLDDNTTLGKLATRKVCRFMSVLTPLVDWPLKRQVFNTLKVE